MIMATPVATPSTLVLIFPKDYTTLELISYIKAVSYQPSAISFWFLAFGFWLKNRTPK